MLELKIDNNPPKSKNLYNKYVELYITVGGTIMVKITKTIVIDFPGNLKRAKPYPASEQETNAANVEKTVITRDKMADLK